MWTEFDEVDFCVVEEGHPDEVGVPEPAQKNAAAGKPNQQPVSGVAGAPHMQPPSRPLGRSTSAAGNYARPPQTPNQAQSRPGPPPQNNQNNQTRPNPQQQPPNGGQRPNANANANAASHQNAPQPAQNQGQGPAPPTGSEPVAFFSARAVAKTGEAAPPTPQPGLLFNPKAESPSIRKTPGIDHTTSKPVNRSGQHVPPSQSGEKPSGPGANAAGRPAGPGMGRGNILNPQLDTARRVGFPGGPASPLANRGQYKPPTIKRPLPAEGAAGRPPLADVSTNAPGAGGPPAGGAAKGAGVVNGDAKRQKIG